MSKSTDLVPPRPSQSSETSVTIVGTGSVGANVSLMLDKLGNKVVLGDSGTDSLTGRANEAFIIHKDAGMEGPSGSLSYPPQPSAKKGPIVLVGAGSVNVNLALILDKLGEEVIVIESASDILAGSPRDTYIKHGDGFEYHHPDHQNTGFGCIDGALTLQMMYPPEAYETKVCHEGNPIRFFVSKESASDGAPRDSYVPPESFKRNIEIMRAHFTERFKQIQEYFHETEEQTTARLGRNPKTFATMLSEEECKELGMDNVVIGAAGTSTGVNMANYYAHVKAALRESKVKLLFGQNIESITRNKDETGYTIKTAEGASVEGQYVLFAAGNSNPKLVSMVEGAEPHIGGTHYLNMMEYVRLPKTQDQEKIKQVSRIGFTLQQEHGCAYTCVLPPTAEEDGVGVIYYPSPKGNQIRSHTYDPKDPKPVPESWNTAMQDESFVTPDRVSAILRQAEHYYPFLKDYAQHYQTVTRSVFNPHHAKHSYLGGDRRVRPIFSVDQVAPGVGVMASPKWTTCATVAMMTADTIRQAIGREPLPTHKERGFGPTNLDMLKITEDLHFKDVKALREDAVAYARAQGLPDRFATIGQEIAKPVVPGEVQGMGLGTKILATAAVGAATAAIVSKIIAAGKKQPEAPATHHKTFQEAVTGQGRQATTLANDDGKLAMPVARSRL